MVSSIYKSIQPITMKLTSQKHEKILLRAGHVKIRNLSETFKFNEFMEFFEFFRIFIYVKIFTYSDTE